MKNPKSAMYAFDHHKEHHVHHPALWWYAVTLMLMGLVVLFGFISVFIPWAVKDIAVGTRAWAYPFKTCLEDTFSDVNEETCIDNDFIQPDGVPLTGANATCKAYVLATIAMVFISVLTGVILLILLGYMLEHMWWLKVWVGIFAEVLLAIVCVAAYLAWIFFLVYGEKECTPNSIFPVHGYSYGFIMYVFVSAFATAALVTSSKGLSRLMRYGDMQAAREELIEELPHYSLYPTSGSAVQPWPDPALPTAAYVPMSPRGAYLLPSN